MDNVARFLQVGGVAAVLGAITLGYAFEYRISDADWLVYYGFWSVLLMVALVCLLCGSALWRGGSGALAAPVWLAPLATVCMFALTCFRWLPTAVSAIVIVLTLAAAVPLMRSRRHSASLAVTLAANILLTLWMILTSRIDRAQADMLPLMIEANQYLLAGRNPYAGPYASLFYYLPITWLSYLPPVALHIDVRLENLIWLTVSSALVVVWARRNLISQATVALLACLLVSRTSSEMVLRGLVWPYWMILIVFLITLLRGSLLAAAVLMGLLLTTQQPTLLFGVMIGWYLLSRGRYRDGLLFGAVALLVYAVVLLPWVWMTPDLLIDVYVRVQAKIAALHLAGTPWDLKEISMLNLLQQAGLRALRLPLQLVIAAVGLILIASDRTMPWSRLLAVVGCLFLLEISANVQIYKYYYYPGLFCVAFGFTDERARRPVPA